MTSSKDALFSQPMPAVGKFEFDAHVAAVFPDMIERSVPGYASILHCISQLTARYAQPNTHCYDLGCSLGASLLAMRKAIEDSTISIVGVDNSSAMISRCEHVIALDNGLAPVELILGDISNIVFKPMSVCVLNFTLQFIPPEKRQALLSKIADSMQPGGVLILSEKLHFDDVKHNTLMVDLHHDFKRRNGYTELEIAQKREAIDNVLIPECFDTHKKRLLNSGFQSADLWFQCFNFSSIVAFK